MEDIFIEEFDAVDDKMFTRFVVDVLVKRPSNDGKKMNTEEVRVFFGCIFNEDKIVMYNPANKTLINYDSIDSFLKEVNPTLGYRVHFKDKVLKFWD